MLKFLHFAWLYIYSLHLCLTTRLFSVSLDEQNSAFVFEVAGIFQARGVQPREVERQSSFFSLVFPLLFPKGEDVFCCVTTPFLNYYEWLCIQPVLYLLLSCLFRGKYSKALKERGFFFSREKKIA